MPFIRRLYRSFLFLSVGSYHSYLALIRIQSKVVKVLAYHPSFVYTFQISSNVQHLGIPKLFIKRKICGAFVLCNGVALVEELRQEALQNHGFGFTLTIQLFFKQSLHRM